MPSSEEGVQRTCSSLARLFRAVMKMGQLVATTAALSTLCPRAFPRPWGQDAKAGRLHASVARLPEHAYPYTPCKE